MNWESMVFRRRHGSYAFEKGTHMKKFLMALATTLFFGSAALAAEIDLTQSTIKWKGSKITGSNHHGLISPKSSSLTVEEGKVVSGSVVMDMNSLTVSDLEGEKAQKFLGHMMNEDFFEVGKYPTATLDIKEAKDGEMVGELTIKGVTKAFSFPVTLKDGKYVGKTTFDRTQFGIIYKSGNFFKDLGDKVINDEVEIEFEIALKAE
jgi:polyisoprenoid-binding protein YceI